MLRYLRSIGFALFLYAFEIESFAPTALLTTNRWSRSTTGTLKSKTYQLSSLGHDIHPLQYRAPSVALRLLPFISWMDEDEPADETYYPAVDRIIAIGDVHGDVQALRGCLRIAGLVNSEDRWIGGNTHLVQLGDILDRGPAERSCIDLLFALQAEARAAGGNVHVLLGNHEVALARPLSAGSTKEGLHGTRPLWSRRSRVFLNNRSPDNVIMISLAEPAAGHELHARPPLRLRTYVVMYIGTLCERAYDINLRYNCKNL